MFKGALSPRPPATSGRRTSTTIGRGRRTSTTIALFLAVATISGCAASSGLAGGPAGDQAQVPVSGHGVGSSNPGPIGVVAAENFWGSIAQQVGGVAVKVTSLVTDPNADPHSYEVNSRDARLFAEARLVVVNGAGYDDWATKVLRANPSSKRSVLDVAALVGKKVGDNPHLWYSIEAVRRAGAAIAADLSGIDPTRAAYFEQRLGSLNGALANLATRQDTIRASYAGTDVAATESIVVYLCQSLGLDLISPPAFMQAVSEGSDPPVATVATFMDQIIHNKARVLLYNSQTATAVTTHLLELARNHHVEVVAVTETLSPPTASYQAWMGAQLVALASALGSSRR